MNLKGWYAVYNPNGILSAVLPDLRDVAWYITKTSLANQEDSWTYEQIAEDLFLKLQRSGR